MYFGAHLSTSGGIDKAAERAIDIGADAIQVFTQSPRMWRPYAHKEPNVERFRELVAEHEIKATLAHAIYLINVASDNPEIYEKSKSALVGTMETAELLGLDAVVFHPGSHKTAGLASCIDRLAKAVHETLEKSERTWLLFENSAGQGGTIGRTTEELAQLFECVGEHPRLGICIDTCHWFVSGVDITDRSVLDTHLEEIDDAIGLDRLKALHINDARDPLGSNRDRHANMGAGEIGEGLGTFLAHPKLQGLPAYLEVPGEGDGPTREELDKVRAIRDRALATV